MTIQRRHRALLPRIIKQFYCFVSASTGNFCEPRVCCVACYTLHNVFTCSLQVSAYTRLSAGHDRTSTSRSSCVSVGDCHKRPQKARHLVDVGIMMMAVWRQSVNWTDNSLLNPLHSEVAGRRKRWLRPSWSHSWGLCYVAYHQLSIKKFHILST
jgi:hypothetical protein